MEIFDTERIENNLNKRVTSTEVTRSRSKAKLLNLSLAIPVLLWFWNGFFIAQTAMSKPLLICIGTGIMCAFLVFLIEKTIVESTSRSIIVMLARILLSLAISIVGVIGLKLTLYSPDIEQVLQQKQIAKDDSLGKSFDQKTWEPRTKRFVDDLNFRTAETVRLKNEFTHELVREGNEGKGPIADAIHRELDTAQVYEKRAELALKTLEDTLLAERDRFIQAKKLPWGLKERLIVLEKIVFQNGFNTLFFIALTFVLWMMEIVLIFVKYTEPLTPEEDIKRRLHHEIKNRPPY